MNLWTLYHNHVSRALAQLRMLDTCEHLLPKGSDQLALSVRQAKAELGFAQDRLYGSYVANRDDATLPPLDAMIEALADDLTAANLHRTADHMRHLRTVLAQEIALKAEQRAAA